ncbi:MULTISPECIES: hypothetical protein [Hyphomonas]|uniref:hypothetical protein n=1 Tax=Hyphomonas TaxID=85 RepID=UPI002355FDC0|nr:MULTISPECIES: hypothetical protein [Hyphomonas]|tara:strand:+ start:666 stop:890 length:225 start_codon:yes stop_codon:yes gene_type:complete
MRKKLWAFDGVNVDLEEGDVSVSAVHFITGTEIKVNFRVAPNQTRGRVQDLRSKLEYLAADKLLDLTSFLEHPD